MSRHPAPTAVIIAFVEAVYPDHANVVLAAFNVEKALKDATQLILGQRSDIKYLKALLEASQENLHVAQDS